MLTLMASWGFIINKQSYFLKCDIMKSTINWNLVKNKFKNRIKRNMLKIILNIELPELYKNTRKYVNKNGGYNNPLWGNNNTEK